MSNREIVEKILKNYKPNELIIASYFYEKYCAKYMAETAFYKTIQRLCESEVLTPLARGIYCKTLKNNLGIIPPSTNQIVETFTKNNKGLVVGYTLFNHLKLTTQISKTVMVYSSAFKEEKKKIGIVYLFKINTKITRGTMAIIQMLEVLEHFNEIQDLDIRAFLSYCEQFSKKYNDDDCKIVLSSLKYLKRTIAFLKAILDYNDVPNNLSSYLSNLSTYSFPSIEELYELARTPKRI